MPSYFPFYADFVISTLSQTDSRPEAVSCPTGAFPLPKTLPPLLFVVDESGCLLSLEWSVAEEFGIQLASWVGRSLEQLLSNFDPLGINFQTDSPVQTSAPWQMQFTSGQLTGIVQLCPLSVDSGRSWMGAFKVIDWVPHVGAAQSSHQDAERQLTRLTWSIRRTLDLETIWQQTVEELAAIFVVEWGLFCTCAAPNQPLPIVATVTAPTAQCPLGNALNLEDYPGLAAVLRAPKPLVLPALDQTPTHAASADGTYLVARHAISWRNQRCHHPESARY
jgi:hypothetical protein